LLPESRGRGRGVADSQKKVGVAKNTSRGRKGKNCARKPAETDCLESNVREKRERNRHLKRGTSAEKRVDERELLL